MSNCAAHVQALDACGGERHVAALWKHAPTAEALRYILQSSRSSFKASAACHELQTGLEEGSNACCKSARQIQRERSCTPQAWPKVSSGA